MGGNCLSSIGLRELIEVCSVSVCNSVDEEGSVQLQTDRHDGYTGVWLCVDTSPLFSATSLLSLCPVGQEWYVNYNSNLQCIYSYIF